ncbi:DUF2784 domain-containing protein [Kribbella sandramycini]|uniref:DUF2784 domain-containing protein n=1 Tax=Kribbella sandramycini TaxID=60450 RepID=A0A7Y4L206_9ACTN|nr:DUF2784 domain-containing protein [Kribbella sandramycini]MBB6565540.1 high-affinity Fe2+/Pb2+ permease [Kribbella sandramycini]NOL41806.1 DUF2784 domain-containing protein [Kribbella sandramycini]
MGWRLLADVMMVLHAAFLLFFVLGGFLAWKWPKVVWAHLAVAVWSLAIVVIDYDCPLTGAEKSFLRRGGEEVYATGYINHYLDGTIWPEGATPTAEKIGFALIVISYVGFFVLRSRRRSRVASVESRT